MLPNIGNSLQKTEKHKTKPNNQSRKRKLIAMAFFENHLLCSEQQLAAPIFYDLEKFFVVPFHCDKT